MSGLLKIHWSRFRKDIDRRLLVLNGLKTRLNSLPAVMITSFSFGILVARGPHFISLARIRLPWKRSIGVPISAVYLHLVVEQQTAALSFGILFRVSSSNQLTLNLKSVTLCLARLLMSWSVLMATVKMLFACGKVPQCNRSKNWLVTTPVSSIWPCHLMVRESWRGQVTKHFAFGTYSQNRNKTRRKSPRSTWLLSRLDDSIIVKSRIEEKDRKMSSLKLRLYFSNPKLFST